MFFETLPLFVRCFRYHSVPLRPALLCSIRPSFDGTKLNLTQFFHALSSPQPQTNQPASNILPVNRKNCFDCVHVLLSWANTKERGKAAKKKNSCRNGTNWNHGGTIVVCTGTVKDGGWGENTQRYIQRRAGFDLAVTESFDSEMVEAPGARCCLAGWGGVFPICFTRGDGEQIETDVVRVAALCFVHPRVIELQMEVGRVWREFCFADHLYTSRWMKFPKRWKGKLRDENTKKKKNISSVHNEGAVRLFETRTLYTV